jgi:hypothetical protein
MRFCSPSVAPLVAPQRATKKPNGFNPLLPCSPSVAPLWSRLITEGENQIYKSMELGLHGLQGLQFVQLVGISKKVFVAPPLQNSSSGATNRDHEWGDEDAHHF